MNSGLCEHCLRVAYLVTDMTILLGMDEKATMDVQLAAIYHDIGKLRLLPSPKCIYEFLECKISLDLQYYIWWIFVRQNH